MLDERIHTLAATIGAVRQRLISGRSEFERAMVLRDLAAAEQEARTTAAQVGQLLDLIVAAEGLPTPPTGGGRAA